MSDKSIKGSGSHTLPSGWVKYFTDGTLETGYDDDITAGKSSWRNGRLNGIRSVVIRHEKQHLCISGEGEYWQSDDFDVPMFSSDGEHVIRRILRKLEPRDAFIVKYQTEHSTMLRVVNRLGEGDKEQIVKPVTNDMVGMWLWMEYNIKAGMWNWGLRKEKV